LETSMLEVKKEGEHKLIQITVCEIRAEI
jgi:hypothetical protein